MAIHNFETLLLLLMIPITIINSEKGANGFFIQLR